MLNLKEAGSPVLWAGRPSALPRSSLPGLRTAARGHLSPAAVTAFLPGSTEWAGGEDKVAVNNRSLNCWPGALKASAAKQFKLSPKHPSGGPGTLSWAQRVCLEEIRLVNLSFTEDG